ncbi:hypothetical protein OV203_26870 [Nannocystis sp. ILAH1]|uniref:hypothetical protein n=1 Tax=Nannocystis sp. ILAH1 TaxID=2996789 RepID=UPI002271BFAD|nr:hypothetical protein [Nannocystis sp. ILAH1]MCY0990797.1 hypothetical protein [Nannocystis sp. ILAH1]
MSDESQSIAAAIEQQNKLLQQIAADLSAIRKIVERSEPSVGDALQGGLTILEPGSSTPIAEPEVRAGGHKVGAALELEQ